MKKLFIIPLSLLLFAACGEEKKEDESSITKCSCQEKRDKLFSEMEQSEDSDAIFKKIQELDDSCNEAANKDKAAFNNC